MTDRYVALPSPPKASWEEHERHLPSLTVYETEERPIDTGLLDATGTKLYRVRDRIKMGFTA